MRAAVLHEVGKTLEIADVEIDRPKAGEVRLEVAASGICRSDLSVIHGTLKSPMPVVLGHEAAGTVVELGEGVTDVSIADRVGRTRRLRVSRKRRHHPDGLGGAATRWSRGRDRDAARERADSDPRGRLLPGAAHRRLHLRQRGSAARHPAAAPARDSRRAAPRSNGDRGAAAGSGPAGPRCPRRRGRRASEGVGDEDLSRSLPRARFGPRRPRMHGGQLRGGAL
ncbi:MAG: alcohol dehydrogenase catalytic domain-containing protein [Myxococcales bacterium]|nr:alcohol dehydrogenase catalytic domain-containing protein [Myxococcales bacterium]